MCSHAQYAEALGRIEAIRKQTSEDESAVQELRARAAHFERKIDQQKLAQAQLERELTEWINDHSGLQLQPLLQGLYDRLPAELREIVYSYLMDGEPVVAPAAETRYCTNNDFDLCQNDYRFNIHIMGEEVVKEIREYFLRTTPIYFRGSTGSDGLHTLLGIKSWFDRPLQEHIRHLRVYSRCETFLSNMRDVRQAMPAVWNDELIKLSELKLYNSYEAYLAPLRNLPFDKHKIKLEICVFYGAHEDHAHFNEVMGGRRHKHNILESVKPTYFYAKESGADVSVRYEYFETGKGADVSWELDLDAEKWAQSPKPEYLMLHEDLPSIRDMWFERRKLVEDPTQQGRTPNVSWKHRLFYPPFDQCVCTICAVARDALDIGCGNPWTFQGGCSGDEVPPFSPTSSDGDSIVVENTDGPSSV